MPQFRRKIAFSGKAKKAQLQAKRKEIESRKSNDNDNNYYNYGHEVKKSQKINGQPNLRPQTKSNNSKYALKFFVESEEVVMERKKVADLPIVKVPESSLEICDNYFPNQLNFPERPMWDYSLSREKLEANENRYFTEYVSKLERNFDEKELSYFELNLETWRQLWRVFEMSDIILFIVDIRYAALMFPPSIYNYVTKTLKKDLVLVFNKIDLVPASIIVAWKLYFENTFPNIHIVLFTTFPVYNLRNDNKDETTSRRVKSKPKMAAEGAMNIFEACQRIVDNELDLQSWKSKIEEEIDHVFEDSKLQVDEVTRSSSFNDWSEHEKYKNNVLTIGCVGFPNVGKSSLINALMGKKVVSISKTPGHTKHFQTIFLTNNVKLCDCPGLVFPSLVPRQVQILMGSFPIAQVREPYSVVQFLAERVDLQKLLQIKHPREEKEWSAMEICEAWAIKKGFFTARAARPDYYRAANHLLRMALEGKIVLYFRPCGYLKRKNSFESHPYLEFVNWVQAKVTNVKSEQVDDNDDD